LPQRLAQNVADSFQLPAVTLYDVATGRQYKGGPEDIAIPDSILKAILSGEIGARADNLESRFALIRLGARPVGVLALRGRVSDTTVDAVSNLVAIGLERARTQEAESRADAARQSEELKSTLLDAIAHEFKTPLTSIKIATTTVLGDSAVSGKHRGLVSIIDEEADRLNGLVSDAIEISRIEGGNFKLRLSSVNASDLLRNVVRQMGSRLQDRSIEPDIAADLPPAQVDGELIQLALRQLLDNAVKYSPPTSPIRIGAERRDGQIVFWVADEGTGIRGPDTERVFERFYRASSNRHGVPGSGLGLAVVREIARAHGGDAVVAAKAEKGARFEMILPITPGREHERSTSTRS
jgi:two-component system sensor histidine kinase KdpD